MQRRKFLATVGSLAAGSAAAMGTGAFSSVTADRDVTVDVVGDADAFLSLEPPEDSKNADAYVTVDDGVIGFDFTTTAGVEGAPEGINDKAMTVFDNLLTVTNLGSQDIHIAVDFLDSDGNSVGNAGQVGVGGPILRGSEPKSLTNSPDSDVDDGTALSPAQSVPFGIFFNMDKEKEFDDVISDLETVQFVAEAVDPEDE